MCAVRLSPGSVCWSVVVGGAVVHVIGALSDAPVLAGQATAVALAGLAVIVLLRAGRGRLAVVAGIGLLAVDALRSAQDLAGPPPMAAFYRSRVSTSGPYSFGDDLAWLGEALSAQLTQHWSALLGIPLICGGTVMALADRPRTDARWPRWAAWTAVAGVALILLTGIGGGTPTRRLVALGAQLPTVVAVAAGLAVLLMAAGRTWRSGVPAVLGASLLTAALLTADLTSAGPVRPVVLSEFHSYAEPAFLEPGYRIEAVAATAVGRALPPGLVAAPMLALVLVLAIALLVLAAPSREPGPHADGPDGPQGKPPGQ